MEVVRTTVQAPGDLSVLIDSWLLSLQARRLSPKTLLIYGEAARLLHEFLVDKGMPTQVASIRREHIEAFLVSQLERLRPATARSRYSALRQLFAWLEDEGEVPTSPMTKMQPPLLPETLVPHVPKEDLERLLQTCRGREFDDVRDLALFRLMAFSGPRLGEVTAIQLGHVSLPQRTVRVMGKGSKERLVHITSKATMALDHYMRQRGRHAQAYRSELWLGQRGPLTESGIAQLLRRRSRAAGLGDLHPHQLRHTAAVLMTLAGLPDEYVMSQMGWSSPQMLARYRATARAQIGGELFHRLEIDADL
jgi:site-specific recombinase XerD